MTYTVSLVITPDDNREVEHLAEELRAQFVLFLAGGHHPPLGCGVLDVVVEDVDVVVDPTPWP